jgi:hypothetical protein
MRLFFFQPDRPPATSWIDARGDSKSRHQEFTNKKFSGQLPRKSRAGLDL